MPEHGYQGHAQPLVRELSVGSLERTSGKGRKNLCTAFEAGKFVIHPHRSRLLLVWDVLMFVLILDVAMRVPYEVAVAGDEHRTRSSTFGISTNPLFVVDMCLQFSVAFPDPAEQRWIISPKVIAYRYLTSMFIIDLLSSFPFPILIWALAAEGTRKTLASRVQILHILKVFRLMRLKRLLQRYEAKVAIPYMWLNLFKLLTLLAIAVHWVACAACALLFIEHSLQPDRPTWVDALRSAKPDFFSDDNVDSWTTYRAALYWSVMTVTSVGYGDITATNSLEAVFMTLIMGLMGLTWAYSIGSMCTIFGTLNEAELRFEIQLDTLNAMLKNVEVANELKCEVREFFIMKKESYFRQKQQEIFENMSPGLRNKLAGASLKPMFEAFPALKPVRAQGGYVVELLNALCMIVYPQREVIDAPTSLGLVQNGKVLHGGDVLSCGEGWGLDKLLIYDTRLHGCKAPMAITLVEVNHLERRELMDLLARFPEQRPQVARMRFMLLVTRAARYGFVRREPIDHSI